MVSGPRGVASDGRKNALVFCSGRVVVPGARRQPAGTETARESCFPLIDMKLFKSSRQHKSSSSTLSSKQTSATPWRRERQSGRPTRSSAHCSRFTRAAALRSVKTGASWPHVLGKRLCSRICPLGKSWREQRAMAKQSHLLLVSLSR